MTHNKYLLIIFFVFKISFSQTIINTESLLREIDSSFVFKINTEADFNFGNIDLIQLNTALSLGKRFKNNLLRISFGHEYISEEKETISNDWTGQMRLNHFFNDNSIFFFVQGQNVVSLKLNHRYLIGAGYRNRIIKKSYNYIDLSAGGFFENELYNENLIDRVLINNFRYSFSSFSNIQISEKVNLNTSIYYQLNSKNLKDYRLFFEPRLYFELKKISFYLDLKYRFHSTPYVNILNNDTEFLFGVEIDL
jgi:hypothetical protein